MEFCLIDAERTPSILLVEDHADSLTVFSRLLEDAGYTVFTASGFNEALEVATVVDFDLLVANLQLGDGCGWELLGRLKALKGYPIPAIAFSGHAFPRHVKKSKVAGYLWHVTKPASPDELEHVIHILNIIVAASRQFLGEMISNSGRTSKIEDAADREKLQRAIRRFAYLSDTSCS